MVAGGYLCVENPALDAAMNPALKILRWIRPCVENSALNRAQGQLFIAESVFCDGFCVDLHFCVECDLPALKFQNPALDPALKVAPLRWKNQFCVETWNGLKIHCRNLALKALWGGDNSNPRFSK